MVLALGWPQRDLKVGLALFKIWIEPIIDRWYFKCIPYDLASYTNNENPKNVPGNTQIVEPKIEEGWVD